MCQCTCSRTADVDQVWWARYPKRTTLEKVRIVEVTTATILVKELGFGPVLRFARNDLALIERDHAWEQRYPKVG